MAETSAIEWTDATVNFWWGCTKVSAACDHCYAETWAKRFGGEHWGAGAPRRKIKGARALLHRLDNDFAAWAADYECGLLPSLSGIRRRVFCMSMGDLFDKEIPLDWFKEAWRTIVVCNRVDIIIVTKRLTMIEKRLEEAGFDGWPQHAWLLTSVHDQASADREALRLLELKSKLGIPVAGFSIEPMLGPISLKRWLPTARPAKRPDGTPFLAPLFYMTKCEHCGWVGSSELCGTDSWGDDSDVYCPSCHRSIRSDEIPGLDWIIAGGESGPNARPSHPDWFRGLRDQCAQAGVPFFFKQHGEWIGVSDLRNLPGGSGPGFGAYDHCQHDMQAESVRVGKSRAGHLLDGKEHHEFPEARR